MRVNITIKIDDEIIKILKNIFTKRNILTIAVLSLFWATLVYAATAVKPYTFSKGDTVMADEINTLV